MKLTYQNLEYILSNLIMCDEHVMKICKCMKYLKQIVITCV